MKSADTESQHFPTPFHKWVMKSWQPTAHGLAICRILYASYLLFFQLSRTDWIGTYPEIFFNPPLSLASLFHSFPPTIFFHALNISIVILLVCLLFGYQTKWSSIGLFIAMLLFGSFVHSFGKINHFILFLITPLVMSFANWGAAWSIDAKRNPKITVNAWPVAMLSLITGFAMFTSGYVKLISGWLDTDSQAILSRLIDNHYASGRTGILTGVLLNIHSTLFWEIADWIIVFFEMSFLLVIPFLRLFRIWIGFAILFHLLVLLTMNIDFSIHVFVFLVFLNWQKVSGLIAPQTKNRIHPFMKKLFGIHPLWLIPIAASFIICLYLAGSPINFLASLFHIGETNFFGIIILGLASLVVITGWGFSLIRK